MLHQSNHWIYKRWFLQPSPFRSRTSFSLCADDKDFLEFSKSKGNDLSTPRPEFNFPGLNEGDAWCLCSMRWLEAYQHASAPKLYLRRTHQEALSVIDLDILQNFALDLN